MKADEILSIFQVYKRFDNGREKTLIQQSMIKNPRKSWTLFYRLFYKALLIINHFFYFASSFAVQFPLFDIKMTQKTLGNWEQQIARNSKSQYLFQK